MRNAGKFFSLVSIPLLLAHVSGAADWRGLAPLRSTRADVERLLGQPERGSKGVYLTQSERITVTYAAGACDYDWRVPPGTVISISVSPKNPPPFAGLRLDERRYEKRRDVHIETLYYYVNAEEGINYTVDTGKGVVTGVEYYPSAKDNNRRCSAGKDSTAATKGSKVTGRVVEKRGKRRKNVGKP